LVPALVFLPGPVPVPVPVPLPVPPPAALQHVASLGLVIAALVLSYTRLLVQFANAGPPLYISPHVAVKPPPFLAVAVPASIGWPYPLPQRARKVISAPAVTSPGAVQSKVLVNVFADICVSVLPKHGSVASPPAVILKREAFVEVTVTFCTGAKKGAGILCVSDSVVGGERRTRKKEGAHEGNRKEMGDLFAPCKRSRARC
jgi:hypothetical protein